MKTECRTIFLPKKYTVNGKTKDRTSRYAFCQICDEWDYLFKHHSKPACQEVLSSVDWAYPLKRRGPIWRICGVCHWWLHVTFTNRRLREMTLDQLRQLQVKAPHNERRDQME